MARRYTISEEEHEVLKAAMKFVPAKEDSSVNSEPFYRKLRSAWSASVLVRRRARRVKVADAA